MGPKVNYVMGNGNFSNVGDSQWSLMGKNPQCGGSFNQNKPYVAQKVAALKLGEKNSTYIV